MVSWSVIWLILDSWMMLCCGENVLVVCFHVVGLVLRGGRCVVKLVSLSSIILKSVFGGNPSISCMLLSCEVLLVYCLSAQEIVTGCSIRLFLRCSSVGFLSG